MQQGRMRRIGGGLVALSAIACVAIAFGMSAVTQLAAQDAAPVTQQDAKPTKPRIRPETKPDPVTTPKKPKRGVVTNLPIPRFVSLKAREANLRRGPSLSHRIDWVFKQRGYPLEVVAEYGHWRRVRDNEDAMGWIHYSLISGVRMAVITDDTADLHRKPDGSSRLNAHAERGVIVRLLACEPAWCQASSGGQKGWVLKSSLWGVYDHEILE